MKTEKGNKAPTNCFVSSSFSGRWSCRRLFTIASPLSGSISAATIPLNLRATPPSCEVCLLIRTQKKKVKHFGGVPVMSGVRVPRGGEEEEEEEDLFVFNDTIEGPRAPAVKPGRVTQA